MNWSTILLKDIFILDKDKPGIVKSVIKHYYFSSTKNVGLYMKFCKSYKSLKRKIDGL